MFNLFGFGQRTAWTLTAGGTETTVYARSAIEAANQYAARAYGRKAKAVALRSKTIFAIYKRNSAGDVDKHPAEVISVSR